MALARDGPGVEDRDQSLPLGAHRAETLDQFGGGGSVGLLSPGPGRLEGAFPGVGKGGHGLTP